MTGSSQPGTGKQRDSERPVVSQFFAKTSTAVGKESSSGKGGGLKKQPSIIELSDSESASNNEEGDDGVQIITKSSLNGATVPAKRRKSSPGLEAAASVSNAKKVKVAPLFSKTKVAQAQVKLEKEETSEAVKRLSQWRFLPSPVKAGPDTSASSPLPDLPKGSSSKKADRALEARRAEVRRRLLGVDFSARASAAQDEENLPAEEDDGVGANSEERDGSPVASTSKLTTSRTNNGTSGGKGKEAQKPAATSNRFAKFAAGSSDDSDIAAKDGAKAKGKGKAKDVGPKYTPLELQVLEIKAQNPDTLLIVEVGYKFKFFGDDAKIASKELNIACFMSQHFYTAMIPVHRLQVHIKRLITQGYKVGVVRQKETAALKRAGDNRSAPFTRELTNLYTAATYVEGLDDDAVTGMPPTFGTLLCLCEESRGGKGSDEKVTFGLVAAQPSTGEVIYDEFDDGFLRAELETRLLHIQPGELVVQGEISGATSKVISYLLKQDAASTGTTNGRLDMEQKKLTYNKALAKITDFYGSTKTESGLSPARKGSKKQESKQKAKKSSEDVNMIDLTAMSSQEAPFENDSDDLNGEESPKESFAEAKARAGDALSVIMGLPERVVIALAGLMQHLKSFQLESVFKRPKYFTPFAERGHMLLNSNTIANLEIFRNQTDFKATGTLLSLLDHTKTAFGQRLLRRWVAKPLLHLDILKSRVDAVDELLNSESYLLGKMRGLLKGLPDLERGLARIHYGKSTPQELVRVLTAFQRIADEFNVPKDLKSTNYGFKSQMVNEVFYALPAIKPVVQEFLDVMNVPKAREGKKEDLFMDEFEPEEITDCKDVLMAVESEFRQHLIECRKILRKPAAEYITVALEEYLLEIRIAEAKVVPNDWIRINGTKSVYRYRSPRMSLLLEERDQAQERLAAQADIAFLQFLSSISAKYEVFRDVVVKLATIDCLLSLSVVGLSPGYVKPQLLDEPCLEVVGGRHPIVEQITDTPFIPNDVRFQDGGLKAMVITGCNMSGKSSYSRMVALLVIMAQIGCYLPCESAKIGIVDYVGTRFGASDEIQRGRSTFMVELTETCEIIKAATPRSLVVLDELGRGTSTKDGLAIAHAVLEYIVTRCRASTLFITHFPQLADVASRYPNQCQLFQMAYIEEEGIDQIPAITFLYKLVPGLTDRVHGISCARMAGLPESVCTVAADKSKDLEDTDQADVRKRRSNEMRRLLGILRYGEDAKSATQIVQYARKLLQ